MQNRNGKGVKTKDDVVMDMISTNTVDTLMIFTNKGKMYRLLVDEVPTGTNASKGVRIGTLIKMDLDEQVVAITSLYRKTNAEYVIFITKNGLIKKSSLEEYTKVKRSTGIAAINIKEGDSIANVTFIKDEDMVLVTKQGMSIHFETKEINPIGRVTAGVKAIKLNENDEVVIGLPIHNNQDCFGVFTIGGYGKQVKLDELPCQARGGKGLSIYRPNNVTKEIISAAMLSTSDLVLISGRPGSICISAKDIPTLGRISMGNSLIKDSIVSSVVKI